MTALTFIRTAGTGLALLAILAAGAAPAMAEEIWTIPPNERPPAMAEEIWTIPPNERPPAMAEEIWTIPPNEQPPAGSCAWRAPVNGCPRPVLTLKQPVPSTVGTPVLIKGTGFEPGEVVTIMSNRQTILLAVTALPDGTISAETVVPRWSGSYLVTLTAIGAVSQYETDPQMMTQDPATITSEMDGLLHGWYPGEELTITLNDAPYPSAYASSEGTFSHLDLPRGKLEINGTMSGGYFGQTSFGGPIGNVRPVTPEVVPTPTPTPDPAPKPTADPKPTLDPTPKPTVDPKPTLKLTDEPVAPVVPPAPAPAPAPARPQPQAAVSPQHDPAFVGLSLAGGSAAAALAGLASFLFVRRIRPNTNKAK